MATWQWPRKLKSSGPIRRKMRVRIPSGALQQRDEPQDTVSVAFYAAVRPFGSTAELALGTSSVAYDLVDLEDEPWLPSLVILTTAHALGTRPEVHSWQRRENPFREPALGTSS